MDKLQRDLNNYDNGVYGSLMEEDMVGADLEMDGIEEEDNIANENSAAGLGRENPAYFDGQNFALHTNRLDSGGKNSSRRWEQKTRPPRWQLLKNAGKTRGRFQGY